MQVWLEDVGICQMEPAAEQLSSSKRTSGGVRRHVSAVRSHKSMPHRAATAAVFAPSICIVAFLTSLHGLGSLLRSERRVMQTLTTFVPLRVHRAGGHLAVKNCRFSLSFF
jgi:hypothetical protein